MVFGTRLLTKDGCSVMIEVVTGVDCSSSRSNSTQKQYPVAPNELDYPEKLPILFSVPMLSDPMSVCRDREVEGKAGRNAMLGLGDVILPGYLIAYCFYVDIVKGNKHHLIGIVSLIGYGSGLLITFLAMFIMNTGQPALIYLVPSTLIPVMVLAKCKGIFKEIWLGELK